MNISVLIDYDLASTLALNYLLAQLPRNAVSKLSVFYTRKTSTKSTEPLLSDLASYQHACLDKLKHTAQSLEALSQQYDFELHQSNHINNADFALIEAAAPDLILSIRHMSILRDAVIALPRHGVINLHSGPLPRFQGVMATFWAMLEQQTNLGTSLHYIDDASIDTGRIIVQSRTQARYDKSYLWNVLNLYKQGIENMIRAIELIDQGKKPDAEAQSGDARYYSYPTDGELQRFIRQTTERGASLFDLGDFNDFFELGKIA